MNYDAIARRISKAIDKASSMIHSSSVHVVPFGTETKELHGLVIVLAPKAKQTTETITETKSQPADSI